MASDRHRRYRCRCRPAQDVRSEEHTSELQSRQYLVFRLLLEKKKVQVVLVNATLPDQLASEMAPHYKCLLSDLKLPSFTFKPTSAEIDTDVASFFLMKGRPPRFTLFPYTTLLR